MVAEAIAAVRPFADACPRHALRIVDDLSHVAVHLDAALALIQLGELFGSHLTGCILRLKVAQHQVGHPHVSFAHLHEGMIWITLTAEFQDWDPQTLLVYTRRVPQAHTLPPPPHNGA